MTRKTLFQRHRLVGGITLTASDDSIMGLNWGENMTPEQISVPKGHVLWRAMDQLQAYFTGELQAFDLPMEVAGSDYQRAVCAEIAAIPYGETRTYGQLAARLGSSAQAVGNACGANPIPILIPCHRVLGSTGLGGFSGQGGVETKVALLRHEGAAGLLI